MMRDELYINGIKVELSDDTGVVLNFAAGDPSDMTAIASGSSYTVSLPLTAHNIQTLGFINHPGSTSDIPNKEHTARLVRGGIPIFENGNATVSGVGNTIDILLTWNRSDELEALSRAKMRDMAITDVMRMDPDNFELSETAYLKWIWNTGYVVNARSGGLGYDVRGFRPAVKVSWLLGRMLPAFSIRADYWAFIERQWIMLPTMLGNSDILSKIGFSLSGSYNYNTSEDKKPDALNRVGSSYTPLAGGYNLYFPQINSRVEHDYIYTPKRGSYRFQGSVNATMASNSSASFKIIKNRTITTDRDGNVVEEYETLFEQTLNGSLVSFDTTKELEEGDKIGIIVSYATAASNTVTLNMNVTFDTLTAANTNTAYLLDYPIRENLPEISMLDFVKGVFGTIGLMTEHTIDGLHMFTADDVILSTDRKDISGMLVDEKETKLTFSRGLTKYNTLGYKDKTDYITFPADTYDKTEHAVVTLPFVLQDTTMYTKGDDKYNLTEGKDARLLLNDGTKSIQIAKRPTNGAVFTYRTLTLSSFTISGLEFETLADTFWRGYIGAFSVSPRIVTKRARLTPDFVQGLSFSHAVYDGQNYYMLLRVSDYNKHGLATLEMALIDGIELESVDLTNVILDGSGGVILFDGTTPALYEPPVSGSGSVSGKLIRELEEYTGEITEDIYIPIDLSNGPARKRKLFNIAHSHANKPILDLITQGHLDVLSHFSVEEGRIKVNTDLWSTGEVSAYGAGSGAGTGGTVGSLGGLANIGLWADEVPASDRIMVQLAGATHWSSMLLSEIVGLDTNALANYLTTNNYVTKSYVTEEISKLNIHTHENKTLLDLITQGNIDVLSHLSIVDGRLKADVDFYSTGEVSAYGAGSSSGGGGGLISSVLGSTGLGGSYLDSDLTKTFNAYAINLINTNLTSATGRITALENSTPNIAWGTASANYIPLSVNLVSKNISIDGHTHSQYLLTSSYTAADILTKIKTVDGASSGLDADLLDGIQGEDYFKLNLGITSTNAGLLSNGIQYVSSGSHTFGGDLPATIEGTVVNFNGYSKSSQALGFKLMVPTSIEKSLYYNSYYSSFRGWVKLYDTQNSNKKTIDWAAKDLAAVNISADGTFLSTGAATLRSTLGVDGLSTLKGISVTNGSYARSISVGANASLQLDGVVSSYTYSLPSTAGWYRLAVSPTGINRPFGQFDIRWTLSSYHGSVSLTSGTMFGSGAFISQAAYTYFGISLTKARIVYHTSYPGNYAYLEIYNESAQPVEITVRGYNLNEWTPYSYATSGFIPSGYTSREISFTSGYATSGNIYALGEVTAYSASDIRLKMDIQPITSAVELIDKLRPVSYKWNSLARKLNPIKGTGTDYGLIAQDLENVMPELVHTIYGDYKSVDYVKLIPHLICAIQQLKMEIDHLKKTYC